MSSSGLSKRREYPDGLEDLESLSIPPVNVFNNQKRIKEMK
jgi:hypothetical protein